MARLSRLEVEYHHISAKDMSRVHQFGPKVLPDIFLGSVLYAGKSGKGTSWSQTLRNWKRWTRQKSTPAGSMQRKCEPVADGTVKNPWRRSTSETIHFHQDRPERGDNLQGGIRRIFLQPDDKTHRGMMVKVEMISKEILVHLRVKLYVPTEESFTVPLKYIDVTRTTRTNLDVVQERRVDDYWNIDWSRDLSDSWTGFTLCTLLEEKPPDGYMWSGVRLTRKPFPLKYIDVSRTAHTNLDVKQEKRIDDNWNIDGSRDLSDPWTGYTQFTLLEEKPPDGYMWSGWEMTRKQLTSRPAHLWPELWKSMSKHAKLKEKQSGRMKSSIWTLDVMLCWRLWNVDGDRELSDTWTGFTRFISIEWEATGWIYIREETDCKTNDLQTRRFVARDVEAMSDASKRKEKTKVGFWEPKLDNARRLFFFCDPEGGEFKDIIENARRKWEIPMSAAMLCKLQRGQYRETCRTIGEHKTKCACTAEATESLRRRMEGSPHQNHEDHIAGKGMNPLSRYNLVHNLFLCLKQWKYQMQRQQWERMGKLEKIPAWKLTRVKKTKW